MTNKKGNPRAAKRKAEELADEKMAEVKKEVAGAAKAEIRDMATDMPHGQGKRFLEIVQTIREIKEKKKLLSKQERGCRASLKDMKVNLKEFDHTFKLSEMEKEDRHSFEAGVAILKEQMGLELSSYEEVLSEEIVRKREAARDAMIDASGGEIGKEIGSQRFGAKTDPEIVNAPQPPAAKIPEKNENFAPVSAVAH